MGNAAQQQPGEGAVAARSRHDQIGALLFRDLRDHMCRASHPYPRRLENHIETFPLQVLDLLPDRGLDLGFVDIDRISNTSAGPELVYVHDD
jgi:hypothetical protein